MHQGGHGFHASLAGDGCAGTARRAAAVQHTSKAPPAYWPPDQNVFVGRLNTRGTMQAACSTVCQPGRAATAARPARSAAVPVLAVARPKRDAQPAKAAKKEVQLQSTLAPSECRPCGVLMARNLSVASTHMPDGWPLWWGSVPPLPPPPRPPLPPVRPAPTPTVSLPASAVAALAAVNPLADFLQGQADYFSTLNLPQGLVQWGEWLA